MENELIKLKFEGSLVNGECRYVRGSLFKRYYCLCWPGLGIANLWYLDEGFYKLPIVSFIDE